jgi:hypothetical protein
MLLAYCARLREMAAGRQSDAGGLDLIQERAALAREQRIGHEIKNAVSRASTRRSRCSPRRWRGESGRRRALRPVAQRAEESLPRSARGRARPGHVRDRRGAQRVGRADDAADRRPPGADGRGRRRCDARGRGRHEPRPARDPARRAGAVLAGMQPLRAVPPMRLSAVGGEGFPLSAESSHTRGKWRRTRRRSASWTRSAMTTSRR